MANQGKSKLEKLIDEAITLGLEVDPKATEATLTDAIKAKKQEIADAKKAEADAEKSKVFFYWVKVKSFKNDSETIEEGLYQTKTENERLSKSKREYVETFVGKIPDIKLHDIAKIYKINIFENNGEEARSSKEILAELVKEL